MLACTCSGNLDSIHSALVLRNEVRGEAAIMHCNPDSPYAVG